MDGSRRRRWRRCLTARKRRPLEGEAGSIVLEAAIVVPVFLLLVMLLVMMIQSAAAQMALQSAAYQTAKQTAAHWHPVALASQQLSAAAQGGGGTPLPQWRSVAAKAAGWLPDPIGTLSSAALRGDTGTIADYAVSTGARVVISPVLASYADAAVLNQDRVVLAEAVLPSLVDEEKAYVELVAAYTFPLRVPITGQALMLKERVMERAWTPDPIPASAVYGSGGNSALVVQIVSLQPEPLRPGRRATVVARTSPNTPLTLSILYKSGFSHARNVGTVVSDANGYAEWTWLVSGNTTPGVWSLQVSAGGDAAAGRTFVVEKTSRG